ncbi:RNA polymerase sigma-70 factor [Sphingobacterium paucimobilis]|uniref:HTH luxR-type domain-containing protein n=1 Tax=Sphingobacterium paucimobilis HER1398 TaxID=1346330 RepID=U2HYW9_9SPHI|nr:RNA polymerase sigma-70 factor [Sphingobacterium paucimobilis]ERJ60460.1 hypothetical protein M472_17040 [Sphingobacterium paucimobilis HER1398]
MAIRPLFNEQELLAKTAKGDHYAFKKLYEHYHKNVYTFSLWYLKSEADAEEVVQETFLKLWLMGEALTGLENLQKYLCTIAGNKSLDMLRSRARRLKTSTYLDDENNQPFHNETEESILLKDFKSLLNEAVTRLPTQQRRVYQLCKEQGFKNDEVAKQLNLSPLTVRTHMKLALRFVRNYIEKHSNRASLLLIIPILKIF